MGKNNDGGSKTTPKKDELKGTIPGTGPMMTQPAFIGDNQNMLAQQLAAGGYGQVPDLMTMLSNTFTPMSILDTRPGAVGTPTPSTPTTPTNGRPGRGNRPERPDREPGDRLARAMSRRGQAVPGWGG